MNTKDEVKKKLRARIYQFQQDLIDGDVADISPIVKHTFSILGGKRTYDVFCLVVHMNKNAHNGFGNDVERSILIVIMEQGDHEGTPLVSVDAYIPKQESTDETADYDLSEHAIRDIHTQGLKSIQHLDESQTGIPSDLDITAEWLTRLRVKESMLEPDQAKEKRMIYQLQQELIDAGFNEVNIIKTPPDKKEEADNVAESAPKIEPYAFMCDGTLIMFYYAYKKVGEPDKIWFYDNDAERAYATAELVYNAVISKYAYRK